MIRIPRLPITFPVWFDRDPDRVAYRRSAIRVAAPLGAEIRSTIDDLTILADRRVVREIAARFGGDVSVLHTGPGGSAFLLELPLYQQRDPSYR